MNQRVEYYIPGVKKFRETMSPHDVGAEFAYSIAKAIGLSKSMNVTLRLCDPADGTIYGIKELVITLNKYFQHMDCTLKAMRGIAHSRLAGATSPKQLRPNNKYKATGQIWADAGEAGDADTRNTRVDRYVSFCHAPIFVLFQANVGSPGCGRGPSVAPPCRPRLALD